MKKLLNILCITLTLIFTLSLFAGCTPNNTADPTPTPTEEASAPTPTPTATSTATPDNTNVATPTPTEKVLSQEEKAKIIGVAFIDFYESYNQYLQETKDSQYLTDYPALNEVSEKEFISTSDGTETFLIMPSDLTASVQVYKLIRGYDKTIKEETLQSELLYEANNANPIVVKCNFSDVVSDVNIVITYKDGSTVEFSPACSGKGGELYIESKNKELIKDLTKW